MSGFIGGLIGVVVGAGGLWAAMATGLVGAPATPALPLTGESPVAPAPAPASAPAPARAPAIAPAEPVAAPSAPAYLIVIGDVYDRAAFIPGYAQKMPAIYAKYGGEYLAVGRNSEVLEGDAEFTSYVISKWPSMDAARAFWNSEEYAPLKDARLDNNWGKFDVFLVEGAAASAPPAN